MPYEEEDVCMQIYYTYTCMSQEEEDTCHMRRRMYVCRIHVYRFHISMCISVFDRQCQKRPSTGSKETQYSACLQYSVKRDLLQCQKRPSTVSKETQYRVKRDLVQCVSVVQCQKRPSTVSKETQYRVKPCLIDGVCLYVVYSATDVQ